jgi:RHS repeat-associated protein
VRDRMVEVRKAGAIFARYGYNTHGLRTFIEDAAGRRNILLQHLGSQRDLVEEEIGEYEGSSGQRLVRYDRHADDLDLILSVRGRDSSVAYSLYDALNSVYRTTSSTGQAASAYSYDAFGTRSTTQETIPVRFGFAGKHHDSTGLIYNRARYLDPGLGAWGQSDPVGDLDGPNRYLYVHANPVSSDDPTGMLARLYCRYINSIPLWLAKKLNARHCAIRIRCEYGLETCSTYTPTIPDTLIELNALKSPRPAWPGTGFLGTMIQYKAGFDELPWSGPTTGTSIDNLLLPEAMYQALPGFALDCGREIAVRARSNVYKLLNLDYHPIRGPNSNSYIEFITRSVFVMPEPSGAVAWNYWR